MTLVVTEAVVLHSFDYLESSRILRIVTADAGVRSVLARGARRSVRRFGSSLDLFAQGTAELHIKPGRDLDTLAAFDVVQARPTLASDLARFTGAAVIAELTLRFGRDAADPDLFVAVVDALNALAEAPAQGASVAALAGAWQIIAALGFAPNLDSCAECHTPLSPDETVRFNHPAGGALCVRCARLASGGRVVPPGARAALRTWTSGLTATLQDHLELRAHQRLLREFVQEHLADDRPLRAFQLWEHEPRLAGTEVGGARQ
jgi:DNA repair protein RecO (recombination protein O)